MACSVDIGTCWIVGARQGPNNQIEIKSIRDAFLTVENEDTFKTMLKMSDVNYIEAGENLYIIGDNAVYMAGLLKRQAVQRPMSSGVLSPGEVEAEKIMLVLLENVLGKATVQDEVCFYSVPANPLGKELDITYHKAMMSKLLSQLGYKSYPLNEAAAIAYSNSAKEQFSALTISTGSGMVNFCLMYKTMIGLAYSIINSGDWIDAMSANAVGSSSVKLQFIKEKGVNLLDASEGDPKTVREREAITVYYKSLIMRMLDSLKEEFIKNKKADFELPNAVPLIIAGGTSMAKNFLELIKSSFEEVKKNFPIPISEIRLASGNPMHAVVQGLLVAALNHEASKKI